MRKIIKNLLERLRKAFPPEPNRCRDCGTTELPPDAHFCHICGRGPVQPARTKSRRDDPR